MLMTLDTCFKQDYLMNAGEESTAMGPKKKKK